MPIATHFRHACSVAAIATLVSLSQACTLLSSEKPSKLPSNAALTSAENFIPQIQPSQIPEIHQNMKTRREMAWKVVQQAFAPVDVVVSGSDKVTVPKWTGWFDSHDYSVIYKSFLRALERKHSTVNPPTKLDIAAQADETLKLHRQRKVSLAKRAIANDLTQFKKEESEVLKEAKRMGHVAGRGTVLFSPSLIKHYLVNHERVRSCKASLFSANTLPEDLAPELKPIDEGNKYAMCFDTEFPRDAVMIKASWAPVGNKHQKYRTDFEAQKIFWTDEIRDGLFTRGPEGDMVTFKADKSLHILDENKVEWVMTGLHISTKEIPEWMWVSIWLAHDPDADFGSDRPDDLVETAPYLKNFKMCAASHFNEKDPNPGSHYVKSEKTKDLGKVLELNAQYNEGMQWCANPWLENGFAKTNCVGCHMAAGEKEPLNFPITNQALRANGLADFLQTFNTFQFLMGGKAKVNSGARSPTQLPDN